MNKANNTSIVKTFQLSIDNRTSVQYRLRRSERATKTRLVVTAEKIEVVAPSKVPERNILAFVESQKDWIANAMHRAKQNSQSIKPLAPTEYAHGVQIPYQGKTLPLAIHTTKAKRLTIKLLVEQQFVAFVPESLNQHNSDRIRAALTDYMKQQARSMAIELIEKHCHTHNLLPRNLRIKTQKSRWGSCGPKNDINLNWLLVLAPPVILEYVVVHELCHIKHKNHSKEFWSLVADHMPDFLQHRHWLKQHGARLMQGL